VTGGVEGVQADAGDLQHGPVSQLTDVIRLGEAAGAAGQPGQQLSGLGAHGPQRIGQQVPIVGMDPAGGVVAAAQRGHGVHVVQVAVGEHHRHRLQPVLGHEVADAVRRIESRVQDQALRTGRGRDHVAVGLPGTGGEGRDEHIGETNDPPTQAENLI